MTSGPHHPARALTGIRVLDLTRVLGGPYCTMILSDHGAEVVKVEPPQGDEVRDWGPPFRRNADTSQDASYFLGVNRNKQAIALDLGKEDGRAVFLRLLEQADILVENFKPGTLERWGLDYQQVLAHRFPKLIHCRISGFGADGPWGGLPGYDAIIQAMSGLMSINGEAGGPGVRIGAPIVDMATGLFAAIGILMALHERTRSGCGQFVDMTLHDCALALLHPHAANWFLNSKRPAPTGNAHPNIAPYEIFKTATDDIFLAIGNDRQFRALCHALNVADLATNPDYASNAARLENRPALQQILQTILASSDGQDLCERLLRLGLPAGPVMPVDKALMTKHARHRRMVRVISDLKMLGTPIKLSRTPGGPHTPPPQFGEHTHAILHGMGLTDHDIAILHANGAIVSVRKR